MKREIRVDRERCLGSGVCQFWAPHSFELDPEGKSVVVDPEGDPEDAIRNAVEGCPMRAIALGAAAEAGDRRRTS